MGRKSQLWEVPPVSLWSSSVLRCDDTKPCWCHTLCHIGSAGESRLVPTPWLIVMFLSNKMFLEAAGRNYFQWERRGLSFHSFPVLGEWALCCSLKGSALKSGCLNVFMSNPYTFLLGQRVHSWQSPGDPTGWYFPMSMAFVIVMDHTSVFGSLTALTTAADTQIKELN